MYYKTLPKQQCPRHSKMYSFQIYQHQCLIWNNCMINIVWQDQRNQWLPRKARTNTQPAQTIIPSYPHLIFFNLSAWARLWAVQMVNKSWDVWGETAGWRGNQTNELPAVLSAPTVTSQHPCRCLDLSPGLKRPQIWTCDSLSECSKSSCRAQAILRAPVALEN